MPHPLSHKYPIPISQLCLVNTDVPAGVGAPPLDTTAKFVMIFNDIQYMLFRCNNWHSGAVPDEES